MALNVRVLGFLKIPEKWMGLHFVVVVVVVVVGLFPMSEAERCNSFLSEDEHNDMQIQGIEVCKCKLERSEEKGLSADKEEVIARLKERSMFQISLSLSLCYCYIKTPEVHSLHINQWSSDKLLI